MEKIVTLDGYGACAQLCDQQAQKMREKLFHILRIINSVNGNQMTPDRAGIATITTTIGLDA